MKKSKQSHDGGRKSSVKHSANILQENSQKVPEDVVEKKNRGVGKVLAVTGILGAIFLCCLGVVCLGIVLISANSDDTKKKESIAEDLVGEEIPMLDYLGFTVESTTIDDYVDLNETVLSFMDTMVLLDEYDDALTTAAQSSNPDDFFTAYRNFNATAGVLVGQAEGMSDFLSSYSFETPSNIGATGIVQPVLGAEGSSIWYYIPILESLVQGKHLSIETSRAGIYKYMRDELDSDERQGVLDEFNLASIEDVRNADDALVEKLARDPVLRPGVDWNTVTTDLGRQAVTAVGDAYKIGLSPDPATKAATHSALRWITGQNDPVENMLSGDRAILTVNKSVQQKIDTRLGDSVGKGAADLADDIPEDLLDYEILGVTEVSLGSGDDDAGQFGLLPGDYDMLFALDGIVPVVVEDVAVQENKTVEIDTPVIDFQMYYTDPGIAEGLGFNVQVQYTAWEIGACSDLGKVSSGNLGQAETCKSNFDACKKNPWYLPEANAADFYECTGSDGCHRITRWVYIDQPSACPIHAGELDYSWHNFQDGATHQQGNINYCECVLDCWNEYYVEKDCGAEFNACCDAILE